MAHSHSQQTRSHGPATATGPHAAPCPVPTPTAAPAATAAPNKRKHERAQAKHANAQDKKPPHHNKKQKRMDGPASSSSAVPAVAAAAAAAASSVSPSLRVVGPPAAASVDSDDDQSQAAVAQLPPLPIPVEAPRGKFDERPPNLLRSFCFWNNKGGVGKTTLSVQTACGMAKALHPNSGSATPAQILFVDLCPQANASQFLLGGSHTGEKHAIALANALPLPRTVGGYLGSMVPQQEASLLQLDPFISSPSVFNHRLRYAQHDKDAVGQKLDNIHLVAGDPYLELAVQVLIGFSDQPAGLGQAESNWVRVMAMLRRGIYNYIHARPEQQFLVFIDTNPSFAVYTQIAAVTAERLICPIAADVSSKVGISGVISLLFGHQLPSAYQAWANYLFSSKAEQQQLVRPRLALVVHNRTHNRKETQVKQYGAMVDEITQDLRQIQAANPNLFIPAHQWTHGAGAAHAAPAGAGMGGATAASASSSASAPASAPALTSPQFRFQYLQDIVDMPSAAVGSSRWGQPILCVQKPTGFVWQQTKRKRSPTSAYIAGSAQATIIGGYMRGYADLIRKMCADMQPQNLDFRFRLPDTQAQ